MFFGLSYLFAAILTLVLSTLWEFIDEKFRGKWLFDPRGGDYGDIIFDIIGIILRGFFN